jgi:hypothetical protein
MLQKEDDGELKLVHIQSFPLCFPKQHILLMQRGLCWRYIQPGWCSRGEASSPNHYENTLWLQLHALKPSLACPRQVMVVMLVLVPNVPTVQLVSSESRVLSEQECPTRNPCCYLRHEMRSVSQHLARSGRAPQSTATCWSPVRLAPWALVSANQQTSKLFELLMSGWHPAHPA